MTALLRKILTQCAWVDVQDDVLVLDGSVSLTPEERENLGALLSDDASTWAARYGTAVHEAVDALETAPVFRGSEFTITVSNRMVGADWSGVLRPQTVEASDLQEALRKALLIPFSNWIEVDGEVAVDIKADPSPPLGREHSADRHSDDPAQTATAFDVVVEPGTEGFSREECQRFFGKQPGPSAQAGEP